ncbi:MAG: TatD family hydrolase [Candidatus Latescibacterota bacterium]|nr:TatD family hydrolase [Candidatus Latescibacterota bacterium]
MLIDTHCHLDTFNDIDSILDQAQACSVENVVAVSQDPESIRMVLDIRRKRANSVWIGLGLHPVWIVQNENGLALALDLLKNHSADADVIGEIGLDFKCAVEIQQQTVQREVLEIQMDIADRVRKPVNLHSRRSQRQTLELAIEFKRRTGLNVQMHWFTESKKLIRICNDEGIYVSVGPLVINDERVQQVALEIDPSLLLLETDAPITIDGIANHPGRVRQVADSMARLNGSELLDVAEQTTENFFRFMSIERP